MTELLLALTTVAALSVLISVLRAATSPNGKSMNSQVANLAAMYFAGFFTAWMLIERR